MDADGPRRAWMFPARRRALLVSPHRRRAMPPTRTLRALGLGRGMTLVDVGCGPGYFAVPAGRIVGPGGAVWACDVSPVMLRETRALAREEGLSNLRTKRCGDGALPLPDGCADMALLAFVAHETASVPALLEETRRVLRPGGRAVLIEWHKKPTEYGPPLWSRLRPPELRRALARAGFAAPEWRDHDGDAYFVTGKKPAPRAPLYGKGRKREGR